MSPTDILSLIFVIFPQLPEVLSGGNLLDLSHSVLYERSLEVVEFMLKRPDKQSLALFGEPVAVKVGGCDGAFLISLDLAENARQGEASLFVGFESAGDGYFGIYVDAGIFSGSVG